MKHALFLLLMATGCSSTQYYFAPKPRTELTPVGMLGATFAAAGVSKDSSLRILPLGIEENNGHSFLPVRFYLENNGADTWRLELEKQKVILKNGVEIVAALSGEKFESKITEVPKGVVRIWDIEFPMPQYISSSTDLKQFELAWEIGASFPFAGRTKFVPTPIPNNSVYTNPSRGKSTKPGKAALDLPQP